MIRNEIYDAYEQIRVLRMRCFKIVRYHYIHVTDVDLQQLL